MNDDRHSGKKRYWFESHKTNKKEPLCVNVSETEEVKRKVKMRLDPFLTPFLTPFSVICEECFNIANCEYCFCEKLSDNSVVFLTVGPHDKSYAML